MKISEKMAWIVGIGHGLVGLLMLGAAFLTSSMAGPAGEPLMFWFLLIGGVAFLITGAAYPLTWRQLAGNDADEDDLA